MTKNAASKRILRKTDRRNCISEIKNDLSNNCGRCDGYKILVRTHLCKRTSASMAFPPFFTSETNFVTSCSLNCKTCCFWKGVDSIRKEFAPSGSKFFPYREDPISEKGQNKYDIVTAPESICIPFKRNVSVYYFNVDETWSMNRSNVYLAV